MEQAYQHATLTRRQVVLLTTSLMLAIALAALDALVVGTAMPTIVGSLGGLSLYSWLVSAYLLTSTATVPLYGRLADVYGRKPIFVLGVVVFVLGSALCGLASSMTQLVVFRAVQGLGAGAVQPMAMTIIGDVFSVEQRARMQGLFSSVWGVSSFVGPPLGALIVSYLSWHWIFYVNVPVGLLALGLIFAAYRERVERHSRTVDVAGVALLAGGLAMLLFALQETGLPGGLDGLGLGVLYVLALTLLGLFVWSQSRSADPTVPLPLLRRPIIGAGYLVGFLGGLTQFGVGTYLPLFVQGAMVGTALAVGTVMAPMSIGWPLGSIASGRLIIRSGYKRVLTGGMATSALGAGCLILLRPGTPLPVLMGIAALVGLGMGLSTTPVIIAIQNAVAWHQRGVATALNQFSRTIGGVVGVALLGSLLNAGLSARVAGSPALAGSGSSASLASTLLDPVGRATLSGQAVEVIRLALAASLHDVYVVVGVAAVVGLVATLVLFPGGSVGDHAREPVARPEAAERTPGRR